MKKFIYRVVALFWLLNNSSEELYFDNDSNDIFCLDNNITSVTFIEMLDEVVDRFLTNWWDVITSDEVDLWTAPWCDSMSYLFLAKIDHGIDLGDWSMSEHHRLWRQSIIQSKGFVRD